jgi:uncharacterized protein
MRVDADGRVVQRRDLEDDEGGRFTLDGHVHPGPGGEWLYTTETERAHGEGWIGVRDARTLAKVAQWRTHGRDPHQLLVDVDGALLVANGGIPRTADGKKRDLDQMRSSLVRLHPERDELLGTMAARRRPPEPSPYGVEQRIRLGATPGRGAPGGT